MGALVATDNGAAAVADVAVDLFEGYVHLTLHIMTTESKECDARLGIMWVAWAPARRSGKSRVQVCVDCTLSPFGGQAMRGTVKLPVTDD